MITILTTGGTIEGLDYVGDKGIKKTNVSISDFLKSANVNFEYTIQSVFKKDSRDITIKDLNLLENRIKESNANKILITHGTFTMGRYRKIFRETQLRKNHRFGWVFHIRVI